VLLDLGGTFTDIFTNVPMQVFTSPFEKGGLRGIYLKNLP
jgi:hypothetical protein